MADKDTKAPKYVAFISYQRKDEEMAKWFHRQLEHYHLPTDINDGAIGGVDDQLRSDQLRSDQLRSDQLGSDQLRSDQLGSADDRLRSVDDWLGNMKNLRPMFLDEAELAGGSLSGAIDSALNNSRFLIVLCSPNSAKSQWVNKEVQAFVDNKRVSQIIPVIIDGIPYTGDEQTECFVPALLELKGTDDERIGINAMAGREMASVKVVSQILGVSFDSLWNRYEREKEEERQRMIEEKRRLQRLESRYLAEKAKDAIAEGNSYLARKLALRALPENIYNDVDRPFLGDASDALCHSLFSNNAAIPKDIHGGVSYTVFCPDSALQYICPPNEESLYGKIFATCSSAGVAFWNVSSGVKIKETPFDTKFSHMSFSHDGKLIVLVGFSKICVYNLEQGCENEIEREYSSFKDYAQFSRCGNYVACVYNEDFAVDDEEESEGAGSEGRGSEGRGSDGAGGADGSEADKPAAYGVVLYDARTLVEVKRFVGHEDKVTSLAFSPDGKRLLSSSYDGTIRLWDVATGECLNVTDVKYKITHIAFNSDGSRLLASLTAKVILLWEMGSGKKPVVLKGHEKSVFYAGFSEDGNKVISVSHDNTVKLWDISSGECIRTIPLSGFSRVVSLSNDSRYIVSGPGINITDLQGTDFLSRRFKNVDTKKMGSPKIAFSNNSKIIYYSSILRESDDLEIYRWNLEDDSVEKFTVESQKPQADPSDYAALKVLNGSVRGLYLSPDDKYLFVDVDNDDIYVLEMPTGKVVKRITINGNKYRTIFSGNNGGQLFIWSGAELYSLDSITLECSWIINTKEIRMARVRHLWGNSEKVLLCYVADDELVVYEYDILRKETVNEMHIPLKGSLKKVDFGSDGKLLFVITGLCSEVWDVDSGKCITSVPQIDVDGKFEYSPDRRFVISSNGNTVCHWDVATGQCFYSQKLDVSIADYIFFSPDGSKCISTSRDGIIAVWDFVEPDALINRIREQYAGCGLSEMEKKAHYLE